MVFGVVVLIFSLFYFARYAKKNFKLLMDKNSNYKEDSSERTGDEFLDSEDTRDTLNLPLNV